MAGLGLVASGSSWLAVCGKSALLRNAASSSDVKTKAIVTDTGGADDKHSTNQLGKVCRLGGKEHTFQKITVSLTPINKKLWLR